jgi:serine/threonine protein kinase
MNDSQGSTWNLEEKICSGGFGTLYSCRENSDVIIKTQHESDRQLIKEEHFYKDISRRKEVSKWLPNLISSGISNGLRFIVLERFPFDLQTFTNVNRISKHQACDMTQQLISALEFIHTFGYSHGDMKSKNVLVRFDEGVITLKLADFGLVKKFLKNGSHVEFQLKKTCCHRGTIPFISEDSHLGVIPSRRSDFENMAWFIIPSLFNGVLPWFNKIRGFSTRQVLTSKQNVKQKVLKGDESVMTIMMPTQSYRRIFEFLCKVVQLDYQEKPDYGLFKELFSC